MSDKASKTYEFRAETSKVLTILTHSLYTNREIFLRELISNASDAQDKLRFLQSRGDEVRNADLPLEIRITVDKVQNMLTISDAGVGMTPEEMVENLGTIAHSGSERFLQELAELPHEEGKSSPDAGNIIGRFGIGFYSVFMVADKVDVVSLSATGDAGPHKWSSDGTGSFTMEALGQEHGEQTEGAEQAEQAEQVQRGTTIRVFLKEDAKEFLEQYRLEGIIRKHSNFIPFAIMVEGTRVNTTPALWREPKFAITKEQYAEFYTFLTYDSNGPLNTLHLSVDAPVQFAALLFIPDAPGDFFTAQREHWGLDLYVRRVLIQRENKQLVPDYLSFFKGVVDTEDLPLNISRETLQENVVLRKIGQTITKQALSHLERMAEKEPEVYAAFWKHHGKVFKLGYSDFANRDRVTPLLRFNASSLDDAEALTSIDDYISRAKEGQKTIWYVAAPSREAAKVNPHLERFRRKGLEVLYLYEPVDEFCLESIGTYKEFSFKAVEHADNATLDDLKDVDESVDKTPEAAPLSGDDLTAFEGLLTTIRNVLGDQVKDVRVSHRLTDSPACLVGADEGITSSMDKIMRIMQKDDSIPKKIFEVNRDHALMRTLLRIHKADPTSSLLEDMVRNLFDSTLLLDGYLKDPHALATRTTKLLEQAGEWYADLRKL